MQKFGVTNKEHYGMLWYFLEWSNTARSCETVCAMQVYTSDGIELAEASAGDSLQVRIRRNRYEKCPWRLEK